MSSEFTKSNFTWINVVNFTKKHKILISQGISYETALEISHALGWFSITLSDSDELTQLEGYGFIRCEYDQVYQKLGESFPS